MEDVQGLHIHLGSDVLPLRHIHISLSVAGADKLTTFWTAQRNP